jgi:WD40 repeat protein
MSVANVTLHPTKPILVTASDDKTWKMWHLPGGRGAGFGGVEGGLGRPAPVQNPWQGGFG